MARAKPDLRVMMDANVLIAGVVWPRWPYEVLRHALQGDFQLVLSQLVIYQARKRIEGRFPSYPVSFEAFLQLSRYEQANEPTAKELAQNQSLVRDVTDIPVALAAINAGVDHLISEDKDLTNQDETTVELHKRLSILLSGTFLREVMRWTSEELEQVRGRTWQDLQSQNPG